MEENIYISNSFEELLLCLKRRLFDPALPLFTPKTVVVPSSAMRRAVMLKLAQDPDLKIVAGVQFVTMSQVVRGLEGKKIPNFIELSLLIQRELQKKEEGALSHYLVSERREVELAESLSSLFIHYGIYGGEVLGKWEKGWQQRLWHALFAPESPWSDPFTKLKGKEKKRDCFHLFGFSFLPRVYFEYFQERESLFYFVSPCQCFWDDEEGGHHSLLSYLGKGGRLLSRLFEGRSDTAECYVEREGNFLHQLQRDMLYLEEERGKQDESVELHAALSKLQEVELLFGHLSSLLQKYPPQRDQSDRSLY